MATVGHAQQENPPTAGPRAREALYEEYAPGLRRRCQRLTSDPHAAEDLLQEVFVRFLARFPEVPAEMNVSGYLYATARNILWKQLRDDHEIADGDIESTVGCDDDLEIDPERALLLVEQQRLVRRCSAVLTGRQRRALTLREVEGRSYAEIGDDLGIGADAVGQVISRARVRLRVAVRRAHIDLHQLSPECRAMLGPLSDYLDGHADESSSEIEAHLAGCESCRSTLTAFRGAGSRLRGLLPVAPLAGIVARLGETVRLGSSGPVDVVRAGSVVVAAALAIGGGSMFVSHELSGAQGGRGAAARVVRTAHEPAGAMRSSRTSSRTPTVSRRGGSGVSAPVRGGTTSRVHAPAVVPAASTSAPVAPPSTTAPKTPVVGPAVTPSAKTPTETTRPSSQGGADPPAVTPPADLTPTAPRVTTPVDVGRAGAKAVTPVVRSVVAPVVERVVGPVVGKVVVPAVAKAVTPVIAPVTKALAPAAKAVQQATDPVTGPASPIATPVTNAVAPVTAPVTNLADAVAPPATPAPAAPAVTTPAPTPPPIVDIPSLSVKIG